MGAEETQIEDSFHNAIRIAKEQKSVSLEKRAEATYAEYRRQKARASVGRGIRLPLWYPLGATCFAGAAMVASSALRSTTVATAGDASPARA